MITLVLGNVGSGKTAHIVRYIKNNPEMLFLTNIETSKKLKNVVHLTADMIIKKELVSVTKNGKENYKLVLNIDFWKEFIKTHDNINIIIDEAHIFFNPRRSMSKLNVIMTDFLALLRRVIGSSDSTGELILITQLSRRLDVISKEMATNIKYCVNHQKIKCLNCDTIYQTTNERPKLKYCIKCHNKKLKIIKSNIEIFEFLNIEYFVNWFNLGIKSYCKRYIINDIEKYYKYYDTLQFNDLFTEFN